MVLFRSGSTCTEFALPKPLLSDIPPLLVKVRICGDTAVSRLRAAQQRNGAASGAFGVCCCSCCLFALPPPIHVLFATR